MILNDMTSLNSADEMMAELSQYGIGSRPFFFPLHNQPVLCYSNGACPISENISRNGFYVPSGLAISADEIDRVSESVIAVLRKYAY